MTQYMARAAVSGRSWGNSDAHVGDCDCDCVRCMLWGVKLSFLVRSVYIGPPECLRLYIAKLMSLRFTHDLGVLDLVLVHLARHSCIRRPLGWRDLP